MPIEEKIAYTKTLKDRVTQLVDLNASHTNNAKMQVLLNCITTFIKVNNTLPEEQRIEVPEKVTRMMALIK